MLLICFLSGDVIVLVIIFGFVFGYCVFMIIEGGMIFGYFEIGSRNIVIILLSRMIIDRIFVKIGWLIKNLEMFMGCFVWLNVDVKWCVVYEFVFVGVVGFVVFVSGVDGVLLFVIGIMCGFICLFGCMCCVLFMIMWLLVDSLFMIMCWLLCCIFCCIL